jgi:hypothetical protein
MMPLDAGSPAVTRVLVAARTQLSDRQALDSAVAGWPGRPSKSMPTAASFRTLETVA